MFKLTEKKNTNTIIRSNIISFAYILQIKNIFRRERVKKLLPISVESELLGIFFPSFFSFSRRTVELRDLQTKPSSCLCINVEVRENEKKNITLLKIVIAFETLREE